MKEVSKKAGKFSRDHTQFRSKNVPFHRRSEADVGGLCEVDDGELARASTRVLTIIDVEKRTEIMDCCSSVTSCPDKPHQP